MMAALHIALRNPPINSKNPAIKVQTVSTKTFYNEVTTDCAISRNMPSFLYFFPRKELRLWY